MNRIWQFCFLHGLPETASHTRRRSLQDCLHALALDDVEESERRACGALRAALQSGDDQEAVASRAALSRTGHTLLDDAAARIGIDRPVFRTPHRLGRRGLNDTSGLPPWIELLRNR